MAYACTIYKNAQGYSVFVPNEEDPDVKDIFSFSTHKEMTTWLSKYLDNLDDDKSEPPPKRIRKTKTTYERRTYA